MSNPTTPGQKINFRIVDFSGEDPQYPATELLTGSPQSKGWQSQRFCDWPQHITMQFFGPVRLKQIQFLSHQCKISTKIELFSALPNLRNPGTDTELKFKKLGYLSLDSNERSGYQSRELKTVYIDSAALYLKIVFHKCHLNKFNLFNQVGLIALGVFGDPLNTTAPEKQVDPMKAKYDRLEYETQYDPLTVQKMKDLEDAKARAVEREDFEEAKRIKIAIDRLRHIGAQLQHLEESKARAIRNEDYDSARIIKIEIDKLREAIAPNNLGRQQTREPTRELPVKHQQFQPEKLAMTPDKVRGVSRQEELQMQQDSRNLRQEEEKKFEPLPRNSYQQQDERQIFGAVPHDEVVPSAIGGNKGKSDQPPEYAEGEDPRQMTSMAENLSAQNSKLAEPLIPIIGDELARKVFSKSWNNREEALKILEGDLTGRPQYINNTDTGAVFVAYMGAIAFTINDKVNQVVLNSLSLLQTLISKPPPHVPSKNELMSYVDGVVTGLLEKIGDNNARVRETSESVLLGMADHPLVTCNFVVTSLTKNVNPTKHKTTGSIKHIVARLNILRELVSKYRINTKEVPYQPVIEYAVDKLENSAPEVRQAASHLIVDIYRVVGGRIFTDLSKVRPNQMELLQKEFDAADGGGPAGGHYEEDKKKPIITTNINPHGNKKAPAKSNLKNAAGPSSGAQGQANRQESPGVPTIVCEFCERKDKNLHDPQKMDIHLWKECPMLTTCVNCAQIVEVAQLNKHLLDECDNKKIMRRCPRCKEAIPMEEYKQHTKEMSCSQALPLTKANRCPLCHQDIAAGEIGWRKHLLTEGCPNNERTM